MRSRIFSIVAPVAVLLLCGYRSPTAQTRGPAPSAFLGTSDLMPELGKQTMPLVPELKQAAQLAAAIVASNAGAITHTRSVKSTDATGAFEKACIAAMQKWRLKPAIQGGQPVPTLVRIRFEAPACAVGGQPGTLSAQR